MTSLLIKQYNLSMRLYKRSHGVYYLEFGRGRARSLKTTDLREAKLRFRNVEREIFKGKFHLISDLPNITLSDFFKEYIVWAEKNRASTTVDRMRYSIQKFQEAITSSRLLSSLKLKDMDTFIDYCRMKKNKPSTINIEIRTIKGIFSQAVKWEYLKENPFKGCQLIRHHKRLPNWLSVNQIEKVFEIIGNNKRYRLMFALFVYTGGRREEIKKLQWKDIREDSIVFRETKSYKPRVIPISEKLQTILSEYEQGVGIIFDVTLNQITHRIKHYLRLAGCGHIRLHDLRHTFATHLRQSGNNLEIVQKLLGHKSFATTLIYAHIDQSELQEAVRKLPY